jgi:hypothetical protein
MCSKVDGAKLKGRNVLEIRLIEFKNPSQKDQLNKSCDPASVGSLKACDPLFEGCVSSKAVIQSKSDCNMGHFVTQEFPDQNDVNFTSILGANLRNPVVMSSDIMWKGNITFALTVHEKDSFSKEIINANSTLLPNKISAPNSSVAKEISMPPFRGPQGSEFRYSIRLYCADNFYGPNCACHETVGAICDRKTGEITCRDNYHGKNCTVYCKPTNRYKCNDNGSKTCLGQFTGPNCTCEETGNIVCNKTTGEQSCKADYYRKDCAIYCKATEDYMCSRIDGTKLYGGIVVEMQLIEFKNPKKWDAENGTCDWDIIRTGDCDPVFEGCISDKPAIDSMKDDCNIGHFITQEYSNTNDVNFTDVLSPTLFNPVIMSTNRTWKGYLTLRVIVHEIDTFKREIINDFNTTITTNVNPKTINSFSQEMKQVFRGPQGSEFHYLMRFYCAENY